MGNSLVLRSADGRTQLAVSVGTIDATLELVRMGGQRRSLRFDLSRLLPVSTTRPWAFRPQSFLSVSATERDGTLSLLGRNTRFETSVRLRFDGPVLSLDLHWACIAPDPVENAAVAVCLDLTADSANARVTMPHILYNDNPSADPDRVVPHFGTQPEACLVCEETRFPIPGVNVEWLDGNAPICVSLLTIPGGDSDAWSLGCVRTDAGLQLLCASGVLALNNQKDTTYGAQCRPMPLTAGYRRLANGDVLVKRIALELAEPAAIGQGFRNLVTLGYEALQPHTTPCLPLERVIELKTHALWNRWHEDAHGCGFICVLPGSIYKSPPYYLFGWTGQSLKLAWCGAKMGFSENRPDWVDRGRRVVDFYVTGSRAPAEGLRYNYYYVERQAWQGEHDGSISSRAFGETLNDLGKLVELFRANGAEAPESWTAALRAAAAFLLKRSAQLPTGILPVFWRPDGTPASDFSAAAGVPCILGILAVARVCHDERCLDGAKALMEAYWRMSGDTFERPFARSTLDARCEDKEAGIYFFLAARELWELTGEPRYRAWAELAADWILTYVYFWDTGFRPGTICSEQGFVTTGWPGVSVQNHHLDVFFPAYELCDFGRKTGNAMYQRLGRMIFDAWSHGICRTPGDWEHAVPGEQGEQFFQTNYFQGPFDPSFWRGGYNRWNPSWIVGLVLEAALRFMDEDQRGAGPPGPQ
ncbi:MAG: hypothetical protein A3K19_18655 [Lentisphaerae bacterium RIFOXYB12_FULL_65_16]|nr:MAG: hypothetical protein A3K18_00945 [Lentisphaerae bacterium RIFOXYA12_64_32]OGV92367.1 MAG: hypothetical protein A3K19_18655 [Lentisphaerae bacterium RIFOXYB12_FULL_65_16]